MKKPLLFALRALVTALLVVTLARVASAQDLPAISPGNPNPAGVLGWTMLSYLAVSALLRALSPANTSLPFAPSPAVLHWVNLVGAFLTSAALAVFAGTPWPQALAAGGLNFVLGLTHVGAAAGQQKAP